MVLTASRHMFLATRIVNIDVSHDILQYLPALPGGISC